MYASGPLSERSRGEERTRERLGSASAFKVLGAEGGCRPLFGTEEEQKPPREEDVALIFIREKRGCRVGSLGGMRRERWRGTK